MPADKQYNRKSSFQVQKKRCSSLTPGGREWYWLVVGKALGKTLGSPCLLLT